MAIARRACPALALALLAGCADLAPTAPFAAPEAVLHARGAVPQAPRFVHRAPHTAPFKNEVVGVTVRAGEAATLRLDFADGSPFAELHIGEESLRGATIDGVPVAEGEPLGITLRRIDASRYLVELQPAGLVFNPAAPAELVFHYENAALTVGEPMSVWKQDRRGQAWEQAASQNDRGSRRMRAVVRDFTVFAMSY